MDSIALRGMSFYGFHGMLSAERELGQRFIVDVCLSVDLRAAGQLDDLAQSVNYSDVWSAVRAVVEGPPVKLIETVGERIAETVLRRFERVDRVWVRVSKPWVPISGAQIESAAIEIERSRAS